MKNLYIFLLNQTNFFLFILLEFLSIWLIVENSNFQRTSIISSTNNFSGNIINKIDNFNEYFNLKNQNEYLAKQNAMLMNRLPSSYLINTNINYTKNDTVYNQRYSYTDAKVINNTVNKNHNYLILNKGKNYGIETEYAVLSTEGIVGFVKDVTDNFCSVVSLLHRDTRITAKIKRSGFFGTIQWEGRDSRYVKLIDIPYHLSVLVGDTVITSGYSTIYPEGIPIGTVAYIKPNKNDNFYSIDVKLATDFNKVDYVYIIKNHFKSEIDSLTNKFKE